MPNYVSIMYNMLLHEGKGYPVGLVALNDKNDIIFKAVNSKGSNNKTNHKNHAESIALISRKILVKGTITLVITFPPCSKCLEDLLKVKGNIKFIHLFDPWGKTQKKYILESKTSHTRHIGESKELDAMWEMIVKRMKEYRHRSSRIALKKIQNSSEILRFKPS